MVQANSRLSGIPDLTMTFIDPDVIDDCSFHPCVRYNRFERDRVVRHVHFCHVRTSRVAEPLSRHFTTLSCRTWITQCVRR